MTQVIRKTNGDRSEFYGPGLEDLNTYLPDEVIELVDQSVHRTISQRASYSDLYHRWERQQWRTEEVDFSQDKVDWETRTSPAERAQLTWFFSLAFHAEERVAVELTPLIEAAPTLEQQIFLTTQLVDEARHTQFFDKFFRETLGLSQPTMGERMQAIRSLLSRGFVELFEVILKRATDRLREGDHSVEAFTRAVVVYHLTVEGMVALASQRYVLDSLRSSDRFPGFRTGFTAIARDESRHVNFGMKYLRDIVESNPEAVGIIQDQLAITMPAAIRVFDPPRNQGEREMLLGFSMEDLYSYAFKTLEKRLRAIKVPPPYSYSEEVRVA